MAGVWSDATYPANNPIEDRLVVGTRAGWQVFGVLDGHGGHQVAERACTELPLHLTNALAAVDAKARDQNLRPDQQLVKDLQTTAIENTFVEFDKEFAKGMRPAYTSGFGKVASVGSCVLFTCVREGTLASGDASRPIIVVNLGDCRAVMGSRQPESIFNLFSWSGTMKNEYTPTALTKEHNARVPEEAQLLRERHPNENDIVICKSERACYVKGRLQLTRALGDLYLKHSDFNAAKGLHRNK